jgi:hypothetical protein
MGPILDLEIVGGVLVALGASHLVLPRVLDWRHGFATLRSLDREVSYVHSYFIGLACVLWGLFPLVSGRVLLERGSVTSLVLVGAVIFWVARLFVQLVVFNHHGSDSIAWLFASVAGTLLWLWIASAWIWTLIVQLRAR